MLWQFGHFSAYGAMGAEHLAQYLPPGSRVDASHEGQMSMAFSAERRSPQQMQKRGKKTSATARRATEANPATLTGRP
jgi:hypothetical protein